MKLKIMIAVYKMSCRFFMIEVPSIFLGQGRLECSTSAFVVSDTSGIPIFSASPREVFIRTESLRVHGEGGTTVQGSVQTPLVRSESGNALR